MNLSPLPIQKFFDNNGKPLDGGLLFTYVAGTSTKVATYTDSTGGTPNTNPVVLDFRGEARVWLDPTLKYKFILSPPGDTDPPTKPIWTVDQIESGVSYSTLTQQFIGGILWPRSLAEIAAAVTPTNLGHPWGSFERYGMDPTGVASSSTGLTNAIAANARVFDEYPGGGNYLFNSTVTISRYPITIAGAVGPIGNGTAGTRFTLAGAAGAGVACLQTTVFSSSVNIENIAFVWQTLNTGQIGISFGNNLRDSKVENCAFVGSQAVGTTVVGIRSTGGTVGNYSAFNKIKDCYLSGLLYGIDLKEQNTVTDIEDCAFVQGPSGAVSYGIRCENLSTYERRGGHFEGFTRGEYSEGAYCRQFGGRYEVNTTNWEWVRGAGNARIWGCALGESMVSGGAPIFPFNDTDACMVITGPGTGMLDTMTLNVRRGYLERGRTVNLGDWATRTFAAGNFQTSGGGTWTVIAGNVAADQASYRGLTQTYKFWIDNSTTTGGPNPLVINVPDSRSAQKKTIGYGIVNEGGTHLGIELTCDPAVNSGTTIQIRKITGATFAATITAISGEIEIEIT